MRKRIVAPAPRAEPAAAPGWLEVDRLAEVELTSEAAGHPIESALRPDGGPGWRAAEPGSQAIRLLFDLPQPLRRIRLVFEERERARTQELGLIRPREPLEHPTVRLRRDPACAGRPSQRYRL